MDEYDLMNPLFVRTIGALIRFIANFNGAQERIKIKLGLPVEIFPEVQRASANLLKDLVSFDQVKWTSMELAQIAAYRFRLFLELYDSAYGRRLKDLDLNRREDVRTFWSYFFRTKQVNRYGAEEDGMTYVMRHTQLLPRQLFRILQGIIVSSSKLTSGYQEFKSEAIRASIEEMEPIIANEIFGGYRYVYPFAESLGRFVFGNFPTIFSYDQLEDRWRKRGRYRVETNAEFEMVHFSDMLIRMGIMGIVGGETTGRYYEGRFGYTSLSPFNIGSGHSLCLHPIFSKYFNAAGNAESKAIIPQGLTTEFGGHW
jgi:hypothetical protein